jgi:hypothetical protein
MTPARTDGATLAQAKRVMFTVPLPPSELGANHKGAWQGQKRLKDDYSHAIYGAVMAQGYDEHAPTLTGQLRAEVRWMQIGKGDVDNCLHRMKVVFDCFGSAPKTMAGNDRFYLGLFDDDSQIARICIERVQVATKREECIDVMIEAIR